MKYKIGEVAEILEISAEMVRYYEKQGVIQPTRDEGNNYRYYTTQDLFLLMEAIQLKSLDIKIKNFRNLKSMDYISHTIEYLSEYKNKLEYEIERKQILTQRIDEMIEQIDTVRYNIDKFWIKKIPAYYQYELLEASGDEYYDVIMPRAVRKSIFDQEVYAFFDNVVEFKENKEVWYSVIEQKYDGKLRLEKENRELKEPQYCLCTIASMGKFGDFSRNSLQPLITYAKENNYIQIDTIKGKLCSRGMENDEYRRFLELWMPIKL